MLVQGPLHNGTVCASAGGIPTRKSRFRREQNRLERRRKMRQGGGGGEEGETERREGGSRFPGNQVVTSSASAKYELRGDFIIRIENEFATELPADRNFPPRQ